MGRYSLVAISSNIRKTIKVSVYNSKTFSKEYKDKVNLASIDKYTLLFDNENQLVNYLIKHNIIKDVNTKLYIEYNCNGIKRIPVVYSKYDTLKHFAVPEVSVIDENDSKFNNIVDDLLTDSLNPNYFQFLVNKKYLNNYLESHISDYLYKQDRREYSELPFIKNQIKKNMTGYKIIRGIIVGQDNYQNTNDNYIESSISEVEDVYKTGGYDELYRQYDLDDLVSLPQNEQKRLGLKF